MIPPKCLGQGILFPAPRGVGNEVRENVTQSKAFGIVLWHYMNPNLPFPKAQLQGRPLGCKYSLEKHRALGKLQIFFGKAQLLAFLWGWFFFSMSHSKRGGKYPAWERMLLTLPAPRCLSFPSCSNASQAPACPKHFQVL